MKPIVALTRTLPEAGMEILREKTALRCFPEERQISRPELIALVADAEGLVCMLTDPVSREVIEAGKKLKAISSYAVGYNNIDIEAARERGIAVTNTPGVLTEATADVAFALLISVARRIVESDAWLRSHEFGGWAPKLFLGLVIAGKTLGIIGAGRIGQALAKRAHFGFGMNIVYYNRTRRSEFERDCRAEYVELDRLLADSDFISIHTPLTPETRHLIGAREFGMMKSTAVLINTARGPIVDEKALIAALKQHRIFGTGLDVFEEEPHIPDELKVLPNAVILPHIGSASVETRDRMAIMAAENCIDVLNGMEPEYRVA